MENISEQFVYTDGFTEPLLDIGLQQNSLNQMDNNQISYPQSILGNNIIFTEPESIANVYELSDSINSIPSSNFSLSKSLEANPFEQCFKVVMTKKSEPNPFEESFKAITTSPPQSLDLLPSLGSNSVSSIQLDKRKGSIDFSYINSDNTGPNSSIEVNVDQTEEMSITNKSDNTDESKFYESVRFKNRKAAAKSRLKKKEWLKEKEEENKKLELKNEELADLINELKNEILNIKMILATHTNCDLA